MSGRMALVAEGGGEQLADSHLFAMGFQTIAREGLLLLRPKDAHGADEPQLEAYEIRDGRTVRVRVDPAEIAVVHVGAIPVEAMGAALSALLARPGIGAINNPFAGTADADLDQAMRLVVDGDGKTKPNVMTVIANDRAVYHAHMRGRRQLGRLIEADQLRSLSLEALATVRAIASIVGISSYELVLGVASHYDTNAHYNDEERVLEKLGPQTIRTTDERLKVAGVTRRLKHYLGHTAVGQQLAFQEIRAMRRIRKMIESDEDTWHLIPSSQKKS